MADSKIPVTFCCFVDLKVKEEAIIFKTINDKQKGISTSLVDAIILLTDQSGPNHIKWAYDLGTDPGSAFYRLVDTAGRKLNTSSCLVTLRTLRKCLEMMMPNRLLDNGGNHIAYEFARNYWNVIKQMWSTEFNDPENYKLSKIPGLKGLSRFGRKIFEEGIDTQDISINRIKGAFHNDPSLINWSNTGPLLQASGNHGVRIVYEALVNAYRS